MVMNDLQELLNRSLVAVELARQEGFQATSKALQAIALHLAEEKKRQKELSQWVGQTGDTPPPRDKHTT